MGKSKKSFWKQMYLSNGWAIDKVVVPAVGILFFFCNRISCKCYFGNTGIY